MCVAFKSSSLLTPGLNQLVKLPKSSCSVQSRHLQRNVLLSISYASGVGNLFTITGRINCGYRGRPQIAIDFTLTLYLYLTTRDRGFLWHTIIRDEGFWPTGQYMEICFDAILYFELGNEKSDASHIKCSHGATFGPQTVGFPPLLYKNNKFLMEIIYVPSDESSGSQLALTADTPTQVRRIKQSNKKQSDCHLMWLIISLYFVT